ncbi:polyprenyl synthetase family protein [Halomonas shantousis]
MVSSPSPPATDCLEACEFLDIRDSINRRLAELLPKEEVSDPVTLAMRESLLMGGKRIRPMLLVLAARGLGHDSPALLDLGCAVEMVHCASLILDDLPCMDNASLRRGRPTIHRRFGEDVAMLTVVALLTEAFGLVAAVPQVTPALRAQLVARLTRAVGMHGLVKGQYEDLHEGGLRRSASAIMTTNTLKTGVLFEVTMAMAALVAGAREPAATSLRQFALTLGQAFQLCDDLTDGHAGQGKDAGQDDGKVTLVALLGVNEARRRFAEHLNEAERHLVAVYGPEPPMARFVRELFIRFEESLAVSAG